MFEDWETYSEEEDDLNLLGATPLLSRSTRPSPWETNSDEEDDLNLSFFFKGEHLWVQGVHISYYDYPACLKDEEEVFFNLEDEEDLDVGDDGEEAIFNLVDEEDLDVGDDEEEDIFDLEDEEDLDVGDSGEEAFFNDKTDCTLCGFFNPDWCLFNLDPDLLQDIRSLFNVYRLRHTVQNQRYFENRQKLINTIISELEGHGRPLHYTVLAEMVRKRYPNLRVSDARILRMMSHRPHIFVKIDQGVYTCIVS